MLRLRPFLDRLTIKATNTELRRLNLDYVDPDPTIGDWGWAQRPFIAEIERQYNAGKPVRIIVLKARQLGISTATEAVLFMWAFLHRGSNSLVISYQDDQAQELFQMMKLYWDSCYWLNKLYTQQYSTKRLLRWLETRSQVRVATAKNIGGSRGSTVNALHASEVAFWPNPGELWTGLNQTIPTRHKSLVVLESTANGMGNWFYEQWVQATEGATDFVPMFFPWWKHPAYRMPTTISVKSELNADETELIRLMTAAGTADMYERIAWRRWAIPNKTSNDIQEFMQEYPATPEEAFIVTGRPVFQHIKVVQCYDRRNGLTGNLARNGTGNVVFIPDDSGSFTIYTRPNSKDQRSDRYIIGGDPSETVAGDPACMQVYNRQSHEVVAVYHNRCNPIHFAQDMILLGEFYHHCMLCPEIEGGGQAAMAWIMRSGYDNIWADKRPDRMKSGFNVYGWSTNSQRKEWAIGQLQRLFVDNAIVIHDVRTYNQITSYVIHEDGYMGNNNPQIHDDAVMALAITVTASFMEGPYLPYSPANQTNNAILDMFNSELENNELDALSRMYTDQGV